MSWLRIGLCLLIVDLLFTATYEELSPNLMPERIAEWEQAYADGQEHIADYLWFAYAHGYGCKLNQETARLWFKRAEGQPLAQLFGCMSMRNRHWIDEFPQETPDFNPRSNTMLRASHFAFTDLAIEDPGARCWFGVAAMELGKKDEAIKQLEMACNEGYYEAAAWLGYIYLYRKKDHKKAHAWLSKAVEHKISTALVDLGDAYNRGWGCKRDRTQAMKYFKQASDFGMRKGMLRWSQHLHKPETLPAIQRAYKMGDPEAAHQLAYRYEHGRGANKDPQESIKIHGEIFKRFVDSTRWQYLALRAAYEQGRIYDKIAIEKQHDSTQHQAAFKWYEKVLAMAKNPKDYRVRQVRLAAGKQFYHGWGQKKNYQKAIEHFQIAADANFDEARMYLAHTYRLGLGQEKNLNKAIELYETALKRLNHRSAFYRECQNGLVACYEVTDFNKALQIYQKQSKQGNADATYRLIEIYRGKKDKVKEIPALIALAAEQGHPMAQQEVEKEIRNADQLILNEF